MFFKSYRMKNNVQAAATAQAVVYENIKSPPLHRGDLIKHIYIYEIDPIFSEMGTS